jgi:predicted nucleic-acid-binding protein
MRAMTGIDTNILVRFFTKDDAVQGERAKEFLRTLTPASPGFVSLICLIELIWVLRSQYHLDKAQLILRLEQLLDFPDLLVESQAAVQQALQRFARAKADFADCLIERLGHNSGCRETVTFDAGAARLAGMTLL